MSFTLRAKRVLALAAAGALALSLFPAGIAAADEHDDICEGATSPFTDTSAPHAANIDCMYSYGVTTGKTATTFDQQGDLQRGQAATLLVEFAVIATDGAIADEIEGEEAPFTDIDDSVHQDNIDIAYELGLVSGFADNTYRPGASINRDQFASILFGAHVALGVEFEDDYDLPYDDIADDNPHADAIAALTGEGIFRGTGEAGVFDPSGDITRGQTASVLTLSARLLAELGLWMAPPLVEPEVPASFTDAPELIGVELQREFTNTVRYAFEFDQPVSTQGLNADNFYLTAWDGTTVSANSVVRDDDADDGFTDLENNKVRAVFDKDFTAGNGTLSYFTHAGQWSVEADATSTRAQWTDATTASVANEAVRGLEDQRLRNPEGAVAVDDVTLEAGITQWPTLVEVTNFDTVDETADFVFDRDLSTAEAAAANDSPSENSFWLVLQSGTTESAQDDGLYEVQSSEVDATAGSDTVTVTFEDDVHSDDFLTASMVNNVARAYVEAGAFGPSPLTSTNVSANGTTQRADLVDYEINYEDDEVLYVFDRPVEFEAEAGPESDFQPELFSVTYFNGQTVTGAYGERPDASVPEEVLISFENDTVTDERLVLQDPGKITEAIVQVGVDVVRGPLDDQPNRQIISSSTIDTGNNTFAEPRTLGVEQTFEGLQTLAPSLLEVEIIDLEESPATGEVTAREVVYTFDRPFQIVDSVNDVEFTLYADDGDRVTASGDEGTISADGLTITFDAPGEFSLAGAGDAVIGGVEFGQGILRNDPAHPWETLDPGYSNEWITNYGTSVPVIESSDL